MNTPPAHSVIIMGTIALEFSGLHITAHILPVEFWHKLWR